jgi:hypothetical protein
VVPSAGAGGGEQGETLLTSAVEDRQMTERLDPDPGEVVESTASGIGEALRSGAADGAQAARDLWSVLGRAVSETAYGGAYYLAYGATFGAMFVGHFIPRDSAFSKGLREGTDDAVSAFQAWEEPLPTVERVVSEAQQAVDAAIPAT